VRIKEFRFGREVAMEAEMVRTGLLDSNSWCSLRKRGKFDTEVIALSVRSSDSS